MEETLRASCDPKTADDDAESIDCAACLCPIDQGDLYRLEACAHPFCKGCIAQQVSLAIKERHFPVVCCCDGCDLPLVYHDFNYLSRQGHIQLPELATAALSAFVQANRDKARFCTTPNCAMVYRVTKEDNAQIFVCPECSVCICTACLQQAHDGMTCAMLRSSKDEKEGVEAWVREDPKTRKVCPGCETPVQKTGGCNKMYCRACRTIFCWHCAKKFKTEKDCYDHLAQSHGIFD